MFLSWQLGSQVSIDVFSAAESCIHFLPLRSIGIRFAMKVAFWVESKTSLMLIWLQDVYIIFRLIQD